MHQLILPIIFIINPLFLNFSFPILQEYWLAFSFPLFLIHHPSPHLILPFTIHFPNPLHLFV